MNKQRKIIVGVLALAITMIIGYALFSENLTINGTAKAEGSFDITAECTSGVKYDSFIVSGIPKDNNYENDSCVVSDNKVTYSASLLQDGAARNFTIKLTNTGTIDAKLNFEQATKKTEYCEGDYDTGECTQWKNVEERSGDAMTLINIVGFEKDGNLIVADDVEKIKEFYDVEGGSISLKPNQSVYIILSLWWDHLGLQGNKVLYKERTTIEFPFKQKTNG